MQGWSHRQTSYVGGVPTYTVGTGRHTKFVAFPQTDKVCCVPTDRQSLLHSHGQCCFCCFPTDMLSWLFAFPHTDLIGSVALPHADADKVGCVPTDRQSGVFTQRLFCCYPIDWLSCLRSHRQTDKVGRIRTDRQIKLVAFPQTERPSCLHSHRLTD